MVVDTVLSRQAPFLYTVEVKEVNEGMSMTVIDSLLRVLMILVYICRAYESPQGVEA